MFFIYKFLFKLILFLIISIIIIFLLYNYVPFFENMIKDLVGIPKLF